MGRAHTVGVAFSALLQAYLERTSVTSADLARRVGVSEPTISRYKRGEQVPADRQIPIWMEVFEMSEEDLARSLRVGRAIRDTSRPPPPSELQDLRREVERLREIVDRLADDKNRGGRE